MTKPSLYLWYSGEYSSIPLIKPSITGSKFWSFSFYLSLKLQFFSCNIDPLTIKLFFLSVHETKIKLPQILYAYLSASLTLLHPISLDWATHHFSISAPIFFQPPTVLFPTSNTEAFVVASGSSHFIVRSFSPLVTTTFFEYHPFCNF